MKCSIIYRLFTVYVNILLNVILYIYIFITIIIIIIIIIYYLYYIIWSALTFQFFQCYPVFCCCLSVAQTARMVFVNDLKKEKQSTVLCNLNYLSNFNKILF